MKTTIPKTSHPTKVIDMASSSAPLIPYRQIRAAYGDDTVTVYQAYSRRIAEAAVQAGTFAPPEFKMDRMTWIKPSFLWMMYRCGWASKDAGQERVLAIEISRSGFEWALWNSRLSHPSLQLRGSPALLQGKAPVRIQWDPERSLLLGALPYRSIQIGLGKMAVKRYVHEWIQKIVDVTDEAHAIHALIQQKMHNEARSFLPVEKPYPVNAELAIHLGMIDDTSAALPNEGTAP